MGDIPEPTTAYPEADVRLKKSFSLVWLIPVIAVVVGGFMAIQAIITKGPLITISFEGASGIVAGKTTVRYKDVTVGIVETIQLSDDLSKVVVEARMDNSIKPHLVDTTKFWVETARISGGQVSGLGTLLSGSYIGMDPGNGKNSERLFEGQDVPPVVTTGLPGRHFILEAETLGSLNIRTPINYRQIQVGEVVSYQLREDGSGVKAKIFINEPYDKYVKSSSRFWVASGIDVKLDAKGIQVNTESLINILYGGISFETPVGFEMQAEAQDGAGFRLFRNHDASKEESYFKRNYYFANFPNSLRGLEPGSSVFFLGFKVGEVVDMKLELDVENIEFKAPVLFYIEPERVHVLDEKKIPEGGLLDVMVKRGLRAQLKNGNLLTGSLYIDLVMDKTDDQKQIDYSLSHPLVPTISTDVEELTASLRTILDDLKKVEFQSLGSEMKESLVLLNSNLEKTDKLFSALNTDTVPQIEKSMDDLRKSIGSDSDFNQDARIALAELAEASRAIKVLAEYLVKHPESLIRGKDNSE